MPSIKYDDFKWHVGGDFPKELPPERALTHMGMFLGWIVDHGLESDVLKAHFPHELELFRSRKMLPSLLVQRCCDGKLTSDDFNDDANNFAFWYYESDKYFNDYVDNSDDAVPSIYHEQESWELYEKVAAVISVRFCEWKNHK